MLEKGAACVGRNQRNKIMNFFVLLLAFLPEMI